MSVREILASSGGAIVILLTLVQIAPIRIDPWSAIGRAIGRVLNGDVLNKIEQLEVRFDEHEKNSAESKADECRADILSFNRELLRGLPHTQEDFVEVLRWIDFYERYCKEHPEYENNRAVLAIENIKRAYMDWQKNQETHKV